MKLIYFLVMSLLLTSCGGGSGGSILSGDALNPSTFLAELLGPNAIYGTAAVGLPLKNAQVNVKCRSSNLSEYRVIIKQGSPATFTITDAPLAVQNSLFKGQSLNFKVGGQLPTELSFYQKYYVVDVVYQSIGNSLTFQLSESAPNELTDGPALSIKEVNPSTAYFIKPDKVILLTGTTNQEGLFEFKNMQSLGAETPCILEASGTTSEDPPAPLVLHSMAVNFTGRVNITPLTEALIASLVDSGKLNTYFYAFDELSALRLKETATANNVEDAWEKIKSGLTGLNIDVSAIKNSPITEPLYAATGTTAGNAYDDLLEAIRTKSLGNESEPYKELLGGKQNLITLIKLDSHGVALKNQFGKWSDDGNEKDGTQWDCVHDTANGVIWEVKRNDPSHFRHKGFKYTWFDSGTLNGGSAGTELNGTCQGLAESTKCNTENLVKAANSALLCGFDKWVLPDIESAKSFPLTNSSAVLASTEYFPEMQSGPLAATSIWTRLPSANNAEGKFAWTFNFASTKVEDGLKSSARPVRLMLPVRTLKISSEITSEGVVKVLAPPPSASDLSIANGQTVNLRTTGYLPTPFSDTETYFVVNYNAGQNSFNLAKSVTLKYTPAGCDLDKTINPCTKDYTGTAVVLTPLTTLPSKPSTLVVDDKNISLDGVVRFNSLDQDPEFKNGNAIKLSIRETSITTKTFFVKNFIRAVKKCAPPKENEICFDPVNSKFQLVDSLGGNPVSKAVLLMPRGAQFVVIAKPQAEATGLSKEKEFCSPAIEVTRNPDRYSIDSVAGEVTDNVTKLVWQQCVYGLSGSNCTKGAPEAMTFARAKTFVRDPVAQPDAWRLPNRKELASLVERKCTGVWQFAEAASGLWMSTRLFTVTGGWEQESNWSNPVVIDSSTAFSADGINWHLKALSTDVYMGTVISKPEKAIEVASKIRIAGESGYGWRDGIPPDPKDGDPTATDSTPTPLWMTSATFSVDGLGGSWSEPIEITKGKGTLEFSADGYSWHSSPLSSDIFMRNGPDDLSSVIIKGEVGGKTNKGATIKGVAFYRGKYGPELEPKGGTYTSPTPAFPLFTEKSKQGMVTGVAFYRGTLPPFNPIGGSFAYPTPSSPGWSDGIPKAFTTTNVISAADSAQAINPKTFPQPTMSNYPQAIWTSDKVLNTDAAWVVNFYNGFETYGDASAAADPPPKDPRPLTYVRLVKNSPTP